MSSCSCIGTVLLKRVTMAAAQRNLFPGLPQTRTVEVPYTTNLRTQSVLQPPPLASQVATRPTQVAPPTASRSRFVQPAQAKPQITSQQRSILSANLDNLWQRMQATEVPPAQPNIQHQPTAEYVAPPTTTLPVMPLPPSLRPGYKGFDIPPYVLPGLVIGAVCSVLIIACTFAVRRFTAPLNARPSFDPPQPQDAHRDQT